MHSDHCPTKQSLAQTSEDQSDQLLPRRHTFRLLLLWLVLLIHGSLYPWEFQFSREHNGGTGSLPELFSVEHIPLEDLLVNVALYIPAGALTYGLLSYARTAVRLIIPVLFSIALSFTVEVFQLYVPTRHGNMADVAINGFGALAGTAAAWVIARNLRLPVRLPGQMRSLPAAGLAVLWLALMLFPMIPVESLSVSAEKFAAFAELPLLRPLPLLSQFMDWLSMAWILRACGSRSPARVMTVAVLLLFAQLMILSRQPLLSDLLGACLGLLMFQWSVYRHRIRFVAWAFLLLLAVRCAFAPEPSPVIQNEFSWVPLTGLIDLEWHAAVIFLLEAMFLYGSGIWLLHAAGINLRAATITVALTAAAAGVLQFYIPDHAPDVTDAMLSLLAGYALSVLSVLTEAVRKNN